MKSLQETSTFTVVPLTVQVPVHTLTTLSETQHAAALPNVKALKFVILSSSARTFAAQIILSKKNQMFACCSNFITRNYDNLSLFDLENPKRVRQRLKD